MGAIPLKNLTVLELDENDETEAPSESAQQKKVPKSNRILLITANGVKYVLRAATKEERAEWVAELKITVASQQIPSSSN